MSTRPPKRPSRPAGASPRAAKAGPLPDGPEPESPSEFRLQKFLASAGLGSRRQCEELIRTGRVTVDGLPVENPGINVNPLKQVVEYDGERLKPERLKYFVLNKPKGVLCTNHDPSGRTRVIDLFAKERVRLFPVGRLDEESEGLLIVTNDGDLANQLAHPRYRIYRTYRVQVAGSPTNETLQQLRDGMYFREGKFQVISVHRAGKQGKSTYLEVVLGQGHNREVRRLFARVGHKVISLERVAFGPIKLQKLKTGQYRELSQAELNELRAIIVRNRSTPGKAASERPRSDKPRSRPGKKTESAAEAGAETETTQVKKRIRRPDNAPRKTGPGGGSAGQSRGKQTSGKQTSGKQSGAKRSGTKRSGGQGQTKSGAKTYDFG